MLLFTIFSALFFASIIYLGYYRNKGFKVKEKEYNRIQECNRVARLEEKEETNNLIHEWNNLIAEKTALLDDFSTTGSPERGEAFEAIYARLDELRKELEKRDVLSTSPHQPPHTNIIQYVK